MRKGLLIGLMGLMGLVGCRTQERVVEVVRTDTLIQTKVERDSVYVESEKRDSVYVQVNGDTVKVERWHTEWRDRWRDRGVHDTLYVSKHDTSKVKEVVTKAGAEKKLSWWQRPLT